jgi:hypothetical protein
MAVIARKWNSVFKGCFQGDANEVYGEVCMTAHTVVWCGGSLKTWF